MEKRPLETPARRGILPRLLLAPSSGGVIARRFLSLAVLVPVATGALSLEIHRRGMFDAGWAIGSATLVTIAVLIAFTWVTARAVDRADRLRREAELEQQRALEQTRFLNETVKTQQMRLGLANQELEAFSYSVSHDLRAPLRHIGGFADLLLEFNESQLDAKGRRRLETIVEAVGRMRQLIDDLLAFSKMARGDLRNVSIDVAELIRSVRLELEAEMTGRRIEFVLHDLPAIHGDRAMFKIVFSNLISNAIKYTGPRDLARIEIGSTAGDQEHETVFFVRDNGVGFDMTQVEKLFGVFQRLHAEAQFPGNGIGLANVRRIVARHGGRTWAEAVENEGATFYFALPEAAEHAELRRA